MITWDQAFEAYPRAKDFGSVTTYAVRNILTAFKERIDEEHRMVVELPAVQYEHIPGQGSICDVVSVVPTSVGVAGAMSFNQVSGRLYRDSGTVMEAVSGIDHSLYIINLLLEDAHTQYLLFDPSAGFETLTGVLTTRRIVDLDVTEADYTGYAGGFKGLVLPRVLHKGIAAAGGNKHYNDSVFFTSSFRLGRDKAKISDAQVFSGALGTGDCSGVIALGDYSFFPYLDLGGSTSPSEMYILPDFIDAGAAFPAGASLNAKIYLVSGGGTITLRRAKVDDV